MTRRLVLTALLALALASCSEDEGESSTANAAGDAAQNTPAPGDNTPPTNDTSPGPNPATPDSDAAAPPSDTQDSQAGDSAGDGGKQDTTNNADVPPPPTDTAEPSADSGAGNDAADAASPEPSAPPPGDAGDTTTLPTDAEPGADSGLEPLADVGEPEPEPQPEWLLSIDNGPKVLQRVDIHTGATTDLCTITPPNVSPLFSNYPSLTFSRENKLFASRGGNTLDLIDPCTCEMVELGTYGVWSGVNGITSDKGEQLLGAAGVQDELIAIATETGAGTLIGPLGTNFTSHGATWSDELGALYAINANDNGLYTINPATGLASFQVTLSKNFGTVGIELLPANGVIYACSSEADLLSVDPDSGEVTVIGPMGQSTTCTNLAAPWANVPCIAP